MKKTIFNMAILMSSALFFASCDNTVEGDKTTTAEAQTEATASGVSYNLDLAASTLGWEGTGVGHGHKGNFPITNGSLNVEGGKITGGNFDINVKGMTASDVTGDEAGKLIGHLLSADFFEAEKFPNAKFAITKVEEATDSVNNATISGNLTLKDSTVNVTFPANVTATDAAVTAKAKFVIDRTKWGMKYGNDKSLGDKFISPEVGIEVNLSAKK
jgi:polyisoprenoid-binding protein YceI